MSQVWLVTGASKGLGQALAQHLLKQGHKVIGTSRNLSSLPKESENYLPIEVNLSDEKSTLTAVEKGLAKFRTIDVLVNNAGYGQGGAVEEVSDKLVRDNFEVNVFGLLTMTRAVLPHFRKQGSGHVMNISSIGGFSGNYSGFGIYCGTKFAVAGITEGLYADLKPLGIHATLVYPGYFRTDFLSSGSFVKPDRTVADYKNASESMDLHANSINHNQAGDPVKAAVVLEKVAAMKAPPLHLFLGPDAFEMAEKEMEAVKADMASVKELSISTNIS